MTAERDAGMQKQAQGRLILLLCVLLWSFGGLVIKSSTANAFVVCGVRSFAGLFPIVFFVELRFRLTSKVILCAFCFSAGALAYALSVKLASAANVILLYYTYPFFVPLIGFVLYRERTKQKDLWFFLV